MHHRAESEIVPERAEQASSGSATGKQPGQRHELDNARSVGPGRRNGAQPVSQSVLGFIQEHPVVATGAAFATGAAMVLFVRSRSEPNRLDRRALRIARSMERTFAREMRALRRSDTGDRLGRFSSSLGDAFTRFDLAPLAERGRLYLDAMRRSLNR